MRCVRSESGDRGWALCEQEAPALFLWAIITVKIRNCEELANPRLDLTNPQLFCWLQAVRFLARGKTNTGLLASTSRTQQKRIISFAFRRIALWSCDHDKNQRSSSAIFATRRYFHRGVLGRYQRPTKSASEFRASIWPSVFNLSKLQLLRLVELRVASSRIGTQHGLGFSQ